ncbi:protein trichome birefringence-like 2 [Papaver somniferum]|uniref:protein trichome birefringence-like 2 n=1 Tax=Papaver somniferum TaxID=3469 RepID=UPI000E6FC9C3|nr:protein trichome birefringence-like 2 [Papaver somniferum]
MIVIFSMVNDRKPYYLPGSCPYIQTQATNCYSNGRPDVEYLKWQWQWQSHPTNAGCRKNIPSFLNATDFLERLRGKKFVFAGDSLNRNMYKAISDKSRIISSGGDFTITYKDYNCTIAFAWTAFLVNHLGVFTPEKETLRLDLIDEPSASGYRDADIIVFDAWHWWNYQKTHDGGGKWNTGGGCNLETEPIPSKHIKLTYYRADAHPSVYGKNYNVQERIKAPQDCSHWCLPGVPDTWNELLYATLLKAGKGSFGNQP